MLRSSPIFVIATTWCSVGWWWRTWCFEKLTLQALTRHTSIRVAAWHLRRVLVAGCWPWAVVLAWLVEQAPGAFPLPRDRVLHPVADSTLKGKHTQKNPWIFQLSGFIFPVLALQPTLIYIAD
ncbi:MAG: hypothetical protein JO189_31345 [Deltaproteobacteria bacterium]|nr:hypothetical protein [Deltaproteobacteria bacterium]